MLQQLQNSTMWKPVPGYEGKYSICTDGTILRIDKVPSKAIKPYKMVSGYVQVCLSNNNKKRKFLLHRLVAASFLDNPENKSEVNHINGIKVDNCLINLEWVTPKENTRHAFEFGLMTERKGRPNPSCAKKVINTATGQVYDRVKDAATSAGIKYATFSTWMSGKHPNLSPFKFYDDTLAK